MTDMKIVTFKKEWRGYAIGETAGFDPAAADALIDAGRARLYVEKTSTEKVVTPPAGKKGAGKKNEAQKPADQQPVDPPEEEPPEQAPPENPAEQQEEGGTEELDEKP
ncbi:hypothetical protein EKA85_10385 [Pseudomonas veronii]|uniref:hypothetical protein n=1 Tax=Pseudomonas veronii TaxID=76761 RepID=UPI000F83CBA8|nr:hypothetical protein [Pseudomonas veronii]RTY68063.1 hypothetical protein EKA85_10385 [Pseudomonas veronii]